MNFRPSGQTQQSPVSVRLPIPNIRTINRPINGNMTNPHLVPRQPMNQFYLLPKGTVNPVQTTTTYPNMVQMRPMTVPQTVGSINGNAPVIQNVDDYWNERSYINNNHSRNHLQSHHIPGIQPPPPYHNSMNYMNGPVINQTVAGSTTISSSTGSSKLLIFFKQLLELSQKSKRTDAHAGVVNLIQKLVNREVNSQTFCTQLQAILKSDNTKTDICPFIQSNIDLLRKDLYYGKFSLPNVQPPRKEMIEDILNAGSTSIVSQQNNNQVTISVNNTITNVRNTTPTIVQNRFNTSTVMTGATNHTPSGVMTSGIPIARFSPANNHTVIQPSIIPAPVQRSVLQTGIISANNSAKMLLSAPPHSGTTTCRLLAPNTANIRPIVQNQPLSVSGNSSITVTPNRPQIVAAKTPSASTNIGSSTSSTPSSANGMSIMNYHGAKMITVPQTNDQHGSGSLSTNDQPFFPTSIVKSRMESYLSDNSSNTTTTTTTNQSMVISEDAAACLAHALHSFTKSLLIRLNIVVQHRTDRLIDDPRLKQVDAVRDQIGFLQRLDEHLMNRQSDLEKELILKAAKSRSKFEDPDQIKVREMAKRLANEDYEREKQHQANLTALSAIQGFKKRRLDQSNNENSSSANGGTNPNSSNLGSTTSTSGLGSGDGSSHSGTAAPASASALLAVKKNTGNLNSSSLTNRLSIGSVKSLVRDPTNSNVNIDSLQYSSANHQLTSLQNIRTISSSAALRTKKACLKDLQFVLSKHKVLSKSRTLYKSYWH